jgi:predicted deacetylase
MVPHEGVPQRVEPSQLLVSLSGIRSATLDHCADLTAELDARGVPASLLVVPRKLGGSAALHWIRQRSNRGDAVLLPGYDHTLDPLGCWGSHTVARLGCRAEFANLPAHEAGLRLRAANILLERLELWTDAFVPPRWLASAGTLQALRRHGYRVCADATAVRDLESDRVYRSRLLGFGVLGLVPGERAEPWWCRAMVFGTARIARRGGLVRIAVDATDLARNTRRSALLDAVDIALHHHARSSTYQAITGQPELAF